jgi:hypothetical protein
MRAIYKRHRLAVEIQPEAFSVTLGEACIVKNLIRSVKVK